MYRLITFVYLVNSQFCWLTSFAGWHIFFQFWLSPGFISQLQTRSLVYLHSPASISCACASLSPVFIYTNPVHSLIYSTSLPPIFISVPTPCLVCCPKRGMRGGVVGLLVTPARQISITFLTYGTAPQDCIGLLVGFLEHHSPSYSYCWGDRISGLFSCFSTYCILNGLTFHVSYFLHTIFINIAMRIRSTVGRDHSRMPQGKEGTGRKNFVQELPC